MNKPLWLLAILPSEAIAMEIHSLQEEIAALANTKRALKIPVHITLEPPFRLAGEAAVGLISELDKFFAGRQGFELELRNFGYFRQDVVFVNVVANLRLTELYQSTSAWLRDRGFIATQPKFVGYTPHVTLANRDVTPQAFKTIWKEFASRKYYAKFLTSAIALLEHRDGLWQERAQFCLPT